MLMRRVMAFRSFQSRVVVSFLILITLVQVGALIAVDSAVGRSARAHVKADLATAASVVFHNHPSGEPSPSPDDIALTRRLVAVGELIGIPVVDHVVLGDARYCSLKEKGEL